MIHLPSKALPPDLQATLQALQETVDTAGNFIDQKAAAKAAWVSKSGATFQSIRYELGELHRHGSICAYCEQNEEGDIEHIYPKSFYPEQAFVWENYLLACKQCNSGYKLDACHVIDEQGVVVKVPRGEQPPAFPLAFINPRHATQNQTEYILLNTQTFEYEVFPGIGTKEAKVAESTLSILKLNNRDALKQGRKETAQALFSLMQSLVQQIEAESTERLRSLLSPYDDRLDFSKPLKELKLELIEGRKVFIQSHRHPSVWRAIQLVDSKVNPRWKQLFDKLPEALAW